MAGIALGVLIAACGTATADPVDPTQSPPQPVDRAAAEVEPETIDHQAMNDQASSDAMDHSMHDSAASMGDPDATPAYDVAGAALVSGTFEPLGEADDASARGQAWLARSVAGTTVTVELTGLAPDRDHVAHVHAAPCTEGGGPHYMHDPDGMPHPPNEIHLGLRSDAHGRAEISVENPMTANDQAVSVVVHVAEDGAPKLACADLSPGG